MTLRGVERRLVTPFGARGVISREICLQDPVIEGRRAASKMRPWQAPKIAVATQTRVPKLRMLAAERH